MRLAGFTGRMWPFFFFLIVKKKSALKRIKYLDCIICDVLMMSAPYFRYFHDTDVMFVISSAVTMAFKNKNHINENSDVKVLEEMVQNVVSVFQNALQLYTRHCG